jgi:uncharacterized damage-inducible protein DinB
MNTAYFQTLYAYHYTVNQRLWEGIVRLSDAEFVQEVDYSIGSVRNHVVHVMDTDQRWFKRIKGESLGERLIYTDFATSAATYVRWNAIEDDVLTYVNTLDDSALERVIDYDLPHRGGMKHDLVWQILAHVVNHGTDHRSQVLRLLYEFGAPTFEQDLMNYLWTR